MPPLKLYDELASWFYLLTAPEDYAEEAAIYADLMVSHARRPVVEVLELGAGGGNNASHMKARFRMTLADVSTAMLAQSRTLNPECEHLEGDMRTLRLGRAFDAVFVHDAVMYMATGDELRAAIATAAAHCRPGGVALFAPDCVAETFHDYVRDGGHDGADGRALRYREATTDRDPSDERYRVELDIRLREADGSERRVREVHTFGLFPKATWLEWLADAGLEPAAVASGLGDPGTPTSYIFLGRRPRAGRGVSSASAGGAAPAGW